MLLTNKKYCILNSKLNRWALEALMTNNNITNTLFKFKVKSQFNDIQ